MTVQELDRTTRHPWRTKVVSHNVSTLTSRNLFWTSGTTSSVYVTLCTKKKISQHGFTDDFLIIDNAFPQETDSLCQWLGGKRVDL